MKSHRKSQNRHDFEKVGDILVRMSIDGTVGKSLYKKSLTSNTSK